MFISFERCIICVSYAIINHCVNDSNYGSKIYSQNLQR